MAHLPSSARCVVIGAGIVGNSLVHHLAELGWRDIVQLDKGPLPNPGGSTGHASQLHLPGRPLPRDHRPHPRQRAPVPGDGRLHRVRRLRGGPHRGADGGAAPPDVVGAKAWGIEAELVTPDAGRSEKVPFLDPSDHRRRLLDARRSASSTRCAPARSCASAPSRRGALTIVAQRRGARAWTSWTAGSARVRTTRATSRPRPSSSPAACGARGSREMAGAHIPLTPAVHQMISVGPVPAARRAARARSSSRSCATWTRSATSASTAPTWRSAPTPTARSCTTPRTSPRSSRRSCRRPRCRSPRTTSTPSSSRPSS